MVTERGPRSRGDSQHRSRRRRDALLRAAVELLSEGGAKAVTHRSVAARAGQPAASATYYFDSIQQLTEEALGLHVAERVAELQALTAQAAEGGPSVERIAQRLADALATRHRTTIIAQFEVYLEAARNPALQEPVARALAAFEELAESLLRALGARRPALAAGALVAVVDGFALHRVARPRAPGQDAAELFEALRALFIAYSLDDETLAGWHERLRQPPPAQPSDSRNRCTPP